jgi:hypothetical protein
MKGVNMEDIDDGSNLESYNSNEEFSHPVLVMRSYVKVQDALSVEMRAGLWQEKFDDKGNCTYSYIEDTRKKAIEAIKTLKNTMVGDIDGDIKKDIKKLLADLEDTKETLLEDQKNWFYSLSEQLKSRNTEYLPGINLDFLYEKGIFYQQYMTIELETYRLIFEKLELCIKGYAYYKRKMFSN